MSRKQTLLLVEFLSELVSQFPLVVQTSASLTKQTALHGLLLAILQKIRSSLEQDIFIPLYPPRYVTSSTPCQ